MQNVTARLLARVYRYIPTQEAKDAVVKASKENIDNSEQEVLDTKDND